LPFDNFAIDINKDWLPFVTEINGIKKNNWF